MKLQAITLAAFLAVAASAKQGGDRRKTDDHDANKKKRELGRNKKKECAVPIFPTTCESGDLQPTWVGVKGEVCLSAGQSLCRERTNWNFGVTAPVPPGMGGGMMGGGGMGSDPIPGPGTWGPVAPPGFVLMAKGNEAGAPMNIAGMGGDRKLGKKNKKNKKKYQDPYWDYYGNGKPIVLPSPDFPANLPEPALPYNLTEASAHLWRGDDCDPVWSFPLGTTDVCVGMVGQMDFPDGALAASSYLVFKNVVPPSNATATADTGDLWLTWHPLIGGDWKSMPRLKLVTDIDDGIVLKFKRGPDGEDNEDALITLDKDGDVDLNPYVKVFFAPDGNRTEAVPVDLATAITTYNL